MLTVGTDTYITVDEADAYVALYHTSTDAANVAWSSMSDGDKEILLRRSMDVLEAVPVTGAKITSSQALQFPRILFSVDEGGITEQASVPDAIKRAQAELACGLSVGRDTRASTRRSGVTSVTVGSASETYGGRMLTAIESWSEDAARLLAPYATGSAVIV
jgi:hypothetical protein